MGGSRPDFQIGLGANRGRLRAELFQSDRSIRGVIFEEARRKPGDIRRANEILTSELRVDHPFAHADLRTALGSIIHDRKAGRVRGRFEDIISKQLFFPEFKKGLTKITYSPSTYMAETWKIARGITVRPNVGFGKPVILDTGVSTLIVANQYQANDQNAARVARLFNVPEKGVKDAFRFERHLKRIVA